jgi:putative GTP pyrophosphokinase
VSDIEKEKSPFDFEAHRQRAVEQYGRKKDLYEEFAEAAKNILAVATQSRGSRISEIQFRAKEVASCGKKAITPSEQNPAEPKYKNPLADITDLAGVRVITFFPRTIEDVCRCIQEQFQVIEKVDHTATAQKEERLGYQSVHYVVRLGANRSGLAEYQKFKSLVAEIQVRTVMQHAWAEIEHDIRYKSTSAIPSAISRRFMTLAGLLEIADREFQAIQEEDELLRRTAAIQIEEGKLNEVEVTPDSLRSYLNRKLDPDDRISDFSYEWTARYLRKFGFKNLGQIDECISGRDDDQLSRLALGTRSGQLTRFELLLAVSMGEQNYLQNHPSRENGYYVKWIRDVLAKLKAKGVPLGSYLPKQAES